VADETRRWFADSSVSYALAALRLFEHARATRADYVFGPLDVESMTDGGLTVSGKKADVDGAAAVLAGVPGLVEQEAAVPD
jgi:hypothetical protein